MSLDFQHKLYFEMYKDKPINPVFIFKKKFEEKHGEYNYFRQLVIDITNYQIKKYGISLAMNLKSKERYKYAEQQKAEDKRERKEKYANKKHRTR